MDAAAAAIDQGKQELPAGEGATSSLKDRIARDLGQRILAGTYAQHAVLPRKPNCASSTAPAAPRFAMRC